MAQSHKILGDEHCECLNNVLRSCATTQEVIEKCKRAGIPVEPAEEENKRQASIAAGVKREFFPDRD